MINHIPENSIPKSGYLPGCAKACGNKDKTVSSPDNKKEGLQEDTLMLSDEGRAAQDIARYAQMVKGMPEVDEQRVRRAAENVRNGAYLTAGAADAAAQKMIEILQEGA